MPLKKIFIEERIENKVERDKIAGCITGLFKNCLCHNTYEKDLEQKSHRVSI